MNKGRISIYRRCTIALFLFLFIPMQLYPQYKFRYDNNYLTTMTFGPEKENGFRISVSLVALFTTGVVDRSGFRLGAGITLSQTIDNWTILTGIDTYQAKQKFGIGTSFAGVVFDDGNYGASYYLNKYYQGDKQISGLLGLHLDDFRIRFEDDILAYPFVGFKIYDRYRSGALELRYKGFIVGTNVYTTDINGITDFSYDNSKGVYATEKQLSSPFYVGYTTNDLIFRMGVNDKMGGLIGQNSWHRGVFDTPDFNYGNYSNLFLQLGIDKPYTLY